MGSAGGGIIFVYWAVALLAGAVGGVLVHEAGHYTACRYFGYESSITINLFESYARCGALGTELSVVRAAGGVPASALFGAMLASAAARRNHHMRLFLLTGAITQAINAVLEVGFNPRYDHTARSLGFAAGLALVIWIERRRLIRREQVT